MLHAQALAHHGHALRSGALLAIGRKPLEAAAAEAREGRSLAIRPIAIPTGLAGREGASAKRLNLRRRPYQRNPEPVVFDGSTS